MLSRVATLLLLLAILVLPGFAEAQQVQAAAKPEWFASEVGRPAPMAYSLPAEPAMPSGCGSKPTKSECSDPSYWSTNTCAKAPLADPKRKGIEAYCTWVFQKEWTLIAKPQRATMLPTTKPTVPYPSLAPGRRNEASKRVEARPSSPPAGRPSTSRRYVRVGTGSTITQQGAARPAAALTSVAFNPARATSTNGTYGSMASTSTVAQASQIYAQIGSLAGKRTTDPGFTATTTSVGDAALAKPPFVQDGPAVRSCEEYAYKRWGDWSKFSWAAARVASNNRAVYELAMDPSSGAFINKPLKQMGVNDPTPMQVADIPGTKFIPMNAFYANEPSWIDRVAGLTAQQRTQIWNAYNRANRDKSKLVPPNDGSPLGVHKAAKEALVSRWGNPLEEELEDISKRKGMYLSLLGQRAELLHVQKCAYPNDPCFVCTPRPSIGAGGMQAPAGINKVLEMVSGSPVINPWESTVLLHPGNSGDQYESLLGLSGAASAIVQLENSVNRGRQGKQVLGGSFQGGQVNFAINLAQVGARTGSSTTPQAVQVTGNACLDELLAKRPGIDAAVDSTELDLTRLLVNELWFGDRGCLKDPGPNQTNICDWSYADFVAMAKGMFPRNVEADFAECKTKVDNHARAGSPVVVGPGQFQSVVFKPENQNLIYPCVRRADYHGSAPNLTKFLKMTDYATEGRNCEQKRQDATTQSLQAAYSSYFAGLKWDPMSGKVEDIRDDGERIDGPLGAYFSYDGGWNIRRAGNVPNTTDPLKGCDFRGSAKSIVRAGVLFFGLDLELFKSDALVTAEASPGRIKYDGYWKDILENNARRNIGQADKALSAPYAAVAPVLTLGGEEHSFYTTIGPFNVRVTVGFGAYAGVFFFADGRSGNNCADLTKASAFNMKAQVVPWASAEAFADAGLDYGVASAGVRVDLTLLSLAVPMGVDVNNRDTTWVFKNGGQVNIGMLSGKLTGYVEAGIGPAAVSVSATLMEWDGFRSRLPAWGLDRSAPNEAMRVLLAEKIPAASAKCKCSNGSFCCSDYDLTGISNCPSGKCSPPAKPEYREIGGKKYLCRFSEDDGRPLGCLGYPPNALFHTTSPGTP